MPTLLSVPQTLLDSLVKHGWVKRVYVVPDQPVYTLTDLGLRKLDAVGTIEDALNMLRQPNPARFQLHAPCKHCTRSFVDHVHITLGGQTTVKHLDACDNFELSRDRLTRQQLPESGD